MKINRVFLIVLDGAGVGEAPDAGRYGDVGANTIGNIARALGGLSLPRLEAAGLGKLTSIPGVSGEVPGGVFGRMLEKSPGKDTTTGHWEMAGLILEKPFPVYPEGFPAEIINLFAYRTGRGVLGNKPASGTEIIKELGAEHLRTGALIVYTSADSVFQIAAHEEVVPLEELYRVCGTAREILVGDHAVGRVIARPFLGTPGSFYRTSGRKDFALRPFGPTVLTRLQEAGLTVCGVGKLEDIFTFEGLTESYHTTNNQSTLARVGKLIGKEFRGLVFANCIDFDMVYGHRNDVAGFGKALEEFDRWLGEILPLLREGDVVVVTADHGCDPTRPGTDHTREVVPLLVLGPGIPTGVDLGIRESFADVAATLCYWFGLEKWIVGEEFGSQGKNHQ